MKRYRLYAKYPSGKRVRRLYKSMDVLDMARAQMWEHNAVTFDSTRRGRIGRGYIWRHIDEAEAGR